VEDRKARTRLRHDVRRVPRIARALVAEALAGAVDDEPALFDGGPRQQAAVRVAHRRIALIRADVAERGAERLAPQHRLTGRAARAEILRATDLGTEARHELAVRREAVHRQDRLARGDAVAFAARSFDLHADHRTAVRRERARAIADRKRNAARLDRGEQVIDQVLAAPRR